MKVSQPLDQDKNYNALLDAFPPGTRFTIPDATRALGLNQNQWNQTRKYLAELRETLHDTDFIALTAKKGPTGGHQFIVFD